MAARRAGQHAQRGVPSLLLARQDADVQPGFGSDPLAELRAVRGLPHGGGGGDPGNNAQNTNVRLGKILRLRSDGGVRTPGWTEKHRPCACPSP